MQPSMSAKAEAQASAEAEVESASTRQPRHLTGVLDEFWLERQGIELLPKVEEKELTYDDRAPRFKRLTAALVDIPSVSGDEERLANMIDAAKQAREALG